MQEEKISAIETILKMKCRVSRTLFIDLLQHYQDNIDIMNEIRSIIGSIKANLKNKEIFGCMQALEKALGWTEEPPSQAERFQGPMINIGSGDISDDHVMAENPIPQKRPRLSTPQVAIANDSLENAQEIREETPQDTDPVEPNSDETREWPVSCIISGDPDRTALPQRGAPARNPKKTGTDSRSSTQLEIFGLFKQSSDGTREQLTLPDIGTHQHLMNGLRN